MRPRGHDTIDHAADMGVRGWGANLEEAFEETALAVFELMAEIGELTPSRELTVNCEARDPGELLVEFLNALLTEGDIAEIVFAGVTVESVRREGDRWILRGAARGAPRADATGLLHTEVKAATYYGVSVREIAGGLWEARCVVDL